MTGVTAVSVPLLATEPGLIITLSGPRGVGKDTLIEHMTEITGWRRLPAWTTRAPRPGEIDGHHYRFVSLREAEAFMARLLVEPMLDVLKLPDHHRPDVVNYYATPIADFLEVVANGDVVVMHMAAHTALRLKQLVSQVVTVAVHPPRQSDLLSRLTQGRGLTVEVAQRCLAADPCDDETLRLCDLQVVNRNGAAKAAARRIIEHVSARRVLQVAV